MSTKRTPIRHGEVLLLPVDEIPNGPNASVKSFIVGHSESNHHHVLECDKPFDVSTDITAPTDIYLFLHAEGRLVHQKEVDKHRTLPVAPGGYKIIKKREFDPIRDQQRLVAD